MTPNGTEVVIENLQNFSKKTGLCIGRSICSVNDGSIFVNVLNLSKKDILIYKNQKVAFCEPLPPPEMISSVTSPFNHELDKTWFDLIINKTKNSVPLTPNQQKAFESLINEYEHIFSKNEQDIGRTDAVHHRINTGLGASIKQKVRPVPPPLLPGVKKDLEYMKKAKIIEPSDSPYCSPVVLVKKRDGSIRFCVDYRKLNASTIKDAYPLPRIDHTLDKLKGSKIFTTLDLTKGYWQVPLHEDDKHKTAFSIGEGLWHFLVLPFGLCNAPPTFQRMMEIIFSSLGWEFILIYLDDIIIFSSSVEQHLDHLKKVFIKLSEAKLKVSPKKCSFLQSSVKYLGAIISENGISVDEDKVAVIDKYPQPKMAKEALSFISLCSYYRRWIKNFADLSEPIYAVSKSEKHFHWGEKQENCFNRLKAVMKSAPVLCFPDFNKPFKLDTDASSTAIGAVLSQLDGVTEKVVAYSSKQLNAAQRNYCATDRELLAIISALQTFRYYLLGKRFTLVTDHQPLTYLKSIKDPHGRRGRWLMQLEEFDFDIIYRSGKKHINADSLSRMKIDVEFEDNEPDNMFIKFVDHLEVPVSLNNVSTNMYSQKLKESQASDHYVQSLNKDYPLKFVKEKDLIFKITKHGNRIVMPMNLIKDALFWSHEGLSGGHLGIPKTEMKLRQRFWWKSLTEDVRNHVLDCPVCARSNPLGRRPCAPLQPIIMTRPLEKIAMDFTGNLPLTSRGHQYILIITDYFSKWIEAFPTRDCTAKTVATCLFNSFIPRFGIPESCHSDQGQAFESKVISLLCEMYGIKKSHTTAFHPQSDGQAEKSVQTIKRMLSKYCVDNEKNWDLQLSNCLFAYRTSPHHATGFTPFKLMFNREARGPLDIALGVPVDQGRFRSIPEFVKKQEEDIKKLFKLAHKNEINMKAAQKRYYDRFVEINAYNKGDTVWLMDKTIKVGRGNNALKFPWCGPYIIKQCISPLLYVISSQDSKLEKTVHHNQLKPARVNHYKKTETKNCFKQ